MKTKKDTQGENYLAVKHAQLLHEWVRIIRELHPHKRTQNPCQAELEKLSQGLAISEKLLLHDLIHSITLVNHRSRLSPESELISTREDLLNALQLLLPKKKRLEERQLQTLEKLRSAYQQKGFTYMEAAATLNCSKTSVVRYMAVLMTHQLVKRESVSNQKTKFYIIIPEVLPTAELESLEENPFEEAIEEWKDFKGFTELHYRT